MITKQCKYCLNLVPCPTYNMGKMTTKQENWEEGFYKFAAKIGNAFIYHDVKVFIRDLLKKERQATLEEAIGRILNTEVFDKDIIALILEGMKK